MRSRDMAGAVLLGIALVVAVLAVGGVPRWALALVAVAAAAAVSTTVRSRRVSSRRSPLLWLLGIGTVASALQVLPLPAALVSALSPTTSELVTDSLQLTGGVRAWATISVDPPATLRAVTTGIALLGLAMVALRLGASERGRRLIASAVVAVGTVAAGIGAVHKVTGATSLYGLYPPTHATPTVLAPILNPNSYACLLVMCALMALALAARREQRAQLRVTWLACALCCIAVALLTLSRGAALALAIGAVVLVVLLAAQAAARSSEVRRVGTWYNRLPPIVIVACVLALVVYASGKGVGSQLASLRIDDELGQPASKFDAWRSSAELIRESPWVGVGRGGFETAFTRVHAASSSGISSHVENEYLQTVIDYGVPIAALLAFLLAACVVRAIRRWNEGPIAAGALAAFAALAAMATVDFGLELLGVAVPSVLLASTLCYVPLRDGDKQPRRWRRVGLVIACVAGAALAISPLTRSVEEDHRRMGDSSRPDVASSLAALRRHPLDYLAAGRAADAAFRRRDPRAMTLLNHALRLHPTLPSLHQLAGRILLSAGHSEQAALEFRIAATASSNPHRVIEEIVKKFPEDKVALMALPPDHANPLLVEKVLDRVGRMDLVVGYYREVLRRRPTEVPVAKALVQLARSEKDWTTAEEAARLWFRSAPTVDSRIAYVDLLVRRGDHARVLEVVGDTPLTTSAGRQLRLLMCDSHAGRGETETAHACIKAVAQAAGSDAEVAAILQRPSRWPAAAKPP